VVLAKSAEATDFERVDGKTSLHEAYKTNEGMRLEGRKPTTVADLTGAHVASILSL
jgi:hypothetical protein